MRTKRRFDGTMVAVSPFNRLTPFIMPTKKDAIIYFDHDIDVTGTLEFIHGFNRELVKKKEILTLFEVVMAAALRALVLRPKLNRFVSNYRIYQRNRIEFSFVAKKELTDDGDEVTVKIPFSPYDTLESVAVKTKRYVKSAISNTGVEAEKLVGLFNMMPDWAIRLAARGIDVLDSMNVHLAAIVDNDPMWCSVFLTNVGSFDLDAPYHHLYERGNCPFFVSVGKIRSVVEPGRDGGVTERKRLTIRYTCDERISEGVYMAKGLDIFRRLVENPAELVDPPVLDEAAVTALGLEPAYPAATERPPS